GEHGLTWHANSLYDELLRVPLFIRLPGTAPRRVEDRVSLMDVGPTILDLFGVDTPPRWMGESLTGYLRGKTPELTRPIVAETRLKRTMVMPDGVKIIHDTRNHSVEVYDITADPGELENLYQQQESADRLQVLSSFFRVHTLKRPGYNVPYRKW
ncbi:MAG TPA: sulfatase/phosphatase domain-containing protein, partial [Candidatus Nanopelagicales bacterium]|nr:sulfatase/phosphatase domain-containing protein [Candidatus Nanopelagicales bacterium]